MVINRVIATTSKAPAPYNTFLVLINAQVIIGKYQEFNLRINRLEIDFGFSIVGFRNKEETTGT